MGLIANELSFHQPLSTNQHNQHVKRNTTTTNPLYTYFYEYSKGYPSEVESGLIHTPAKFLPFPFSNEIRSQRQLRASPSSRGGHPLSPCLPSRLPCVKAMSAMLSTFPTTSFATYLLATLSRYNTGNVLELVHIHLLRLVHVVKPLADQDELVHDDRRTEQGERASLATFDDNRRTAGTMHLMRDKNEVTCIGNGREPGCDHGLSRKPLSVKRSYGISRKIFRLNR